MGEDRGNCPVWRPVRARPSSSHSLGGTLAISIMPRQDTLGEVVVLLVLTGARTEVPGLTALVVVMVAKVVLDPTWTSPLSPFPPSSSLLDKEEDTEDYTAFTGAEEEESWWTGLVH